MELFAASSTHFLKNKKEDINVPFIKKDYLHPLIINTKVYRIKWVDEFRIKSKLLII